MRFKDKVAIITGAGQGIGRTFAEALLAEGASVGLIDMDAALGAETAAALSAGGGRVHFAACDVTDEAGVNAAVAQIAGALGGVDILVNGAAKHLKYYNQAPTKLPRDEWRLLLNVNVVGVVNGAAACRPFMAARGGGVIINMSSISSWMLSGAYGVSKLAVRGLTVALAQEFAEDNIRVCGIAPGMVDTPSTVGNITPGLAEELINKRQLIKRQGRMGDLTGALFYLCSDDAAFVTGETIVVGGGYPLRP